MLHGKILLSILILALLFPFPTLAQSSPSQDPFALTPDKTSLFGGYDPNTSVNSLFNGDSQKNNGLFSTPSTQLGGATPYNELIAPDRDNTETAPASIILHSHYSPTGDLTSSTTITVTATVTNQGGTLQKAITFHALLQDHNAAMTGKQPLLMAAAFTPDSSIATELASKPFDLAPGQGITFSWIIKAHKDDSILRWRLSATFGAAESVLLQWIPIKNPNPQAGGGPGTGGSGSYSNPCSSVGGSGPFPDSASYDTIKTAFKQHWNIDLVASGTDFANQKYHGVLKAWWEVLTTVECTPFLTEAIGNNPLQLIGIGGSGGGWWGEYMGGNVQHMWIDNISNGTVPHIKQNLIHELGHVWRGGQPAKYAAYESATCGKGSVHPFVSIYGGTNCSENMAEIVGYYVQRDSNEWGVGGAFCATKNPYDWNQSFYYDWAKTTVFGGKEYGSPPPNPATSC